MINYMVYMGIITLLDGPLDNVTGHQLVTIELPRLPFGSYKMAFLSMGDASHFKMHPTVSADLELDIFLENVGTTYPIILSNEMDI